MSGGKNKDVKFKIPLKSSIELVTTHEATRAGFLSIALEKNRSASKFVAQARQLKILASKAKSPKDLLNLIEIRAGLLSATGLSDKAISNLQEQDQIFAVREFIDKYLDPSGAAFVDELVYRFLLTKGDALGGEMRNITGALAQRKFTDCVVGCLELAGIEYFWQKNKESTWRVSNDEKPSGDTDLKAISWKTKKTSRFLTFNLTLKVVDNKNVDVILLNVLHTEFNRGVLLKPESYVALGELKGGIDPAGADEHWKTAKTALQRINLTFQSQPVKPLTFFVGASIVNSMAGQIWGELEKEELHYAANMTVVKQLTSLCSWLVNL